MTATSVVSAPIRIVSLLPGATEIVCALGLGDALVGVSHECDWPPAVRALPALTQSAIPPGLPPGETDRLVHERVAQGEGLYTLDAALLARLAPTLIITQALCDVCSIALPDVLRAARSLPVMPQVVSLEPGTIAEIFVDIRQVAVTAGVPERADRLLRDVTARLAAVRAAVAGRRRPRVVLLEWLDPPFIAGHWAPEMIAAAGGEDTLGAVGERSRPVSWETVRAAEPDVIVVAPCGYDELRAWTELRSVSLPAWWTDLTAVRAGRVIVLDGNAHVSRPGPRIVDGIEHLARYLHPEVICDEERPRAGNRGGAVRIPGGA